MDFSFLKNRTPSVKVRKTVVLHKQNVQKLHIYLQKTKDGPRYCEHEKRRLLCMSQMVSLLLISSFAGGFK